jgi:hypothetical protein
MTTRDFVKRLLGFFIFISILTIGINFLIAVKGVPNSAKVAYRQLENNEIEFDGSINLICPKCGYPKEHWVRMILTDDGKIDSTKSGLFPKGRQ